MLNTGARLALSQTEAVISLIRHLRSEIECFSMPLPRALCRCPREILSACGYREERAPDSVGELLPYISDGTVRGQLSRFCEEIGKGYREEQLALCDYYVAVLEDRRASLASQLPSRRRMNSALCMSGALALVILLF